MTALTAVRLGGRPDLPLLVLGPALGTTATGLWAQTAALLAEDFQVVGWDLPGHGTNRVAVEGPVSVADLAAGVLDLVNTMGQGLQPPSFHYAGVSVGGAVGLQLLLDAPRRVESATLLCTGARLGDPDMWAERAATVRASGTASLGAASAERWFAPGLLDRAPERGSALLRALAEVDDEGYAAVCGALAAYDVRERLTTIGAPVLAVAGAHDVATPPDRLREIADGVRDGRLVVLDGVAHLAPAEAPEAVARLIREHVLGPSRDTMTVAEVRAAGMEVRREVLGDAHVDAEIARAGELTRDFEELVTELAWGSVWTRPGLDLRSRSMVAITALVARGHHAELAPHVRAALTHGVSVEEIKELLLQTAIYCGVPDAAAALRIVEQVLEES